MRSCKLEFTAKLKRNHVDQGKYGYPLLGACCASLVPGIVCFCGDCSLELPKRHWPDHVVVHAMLPERMEIACA